jgi:arylsulfatase A-like enzyme
MLDHDDIVGDLLDLLDELGLADDTIVIYSTDNGPHLNTWPDSGMTPFRNEKNSNWEGAYRVPCVVRWPDRIPPAGPQRHRQPQRLVRHPARGRRRARRGRPLQAGAELGGTSVPGPPRRPRPAAVPAGEVDESPRQHFFYVSDDGDLTAVRFDNWKVVFMEQRAAGTLQVWAEPYTELRVPKIFNLRTDPYERADITSNTYYDWLLDRAWILVPIQAYVADDDRCSPDARRVPSPDARTPAMAFTI